jgi:hypothetical protein
LAVLTTSNMRDSGAVASNNYYHRLAELLPDYRHSKQSYAYVVSGWQALNHWLDVTHAGQRGKSTARASKHFTLIGYALSQSLLREHDRRQLPAFFRWANLEPDDPLTAADLVPLLTRWSDPSSCRLSSHGCAHLRNPSLQQAIAEIALDELRAWTGDLEARDEPDTQRDPRSRTAPAFLLLKPGRGRRVGLTLIPRRLDGFPASLAFGDSTIRAIDVPGWYEQIDVPSPFGPVEWRTADRRFGIRSDPPPVIALVEDSDLGPLAPGEPPALGPRGDRPRRTRRPRGSRAGASGSRPTRLARRRGGRPAARSALNRTSPRSPVSSRYSVKRSASAPDSPLIEPPGRTLLSTSSRRRG